MSRQFSRRARPLVVLGATLVSAAALMTGAQANAAAPSNISCTVNPSAVGNANGMNYSSNVSCGQAVTKLNILAQVQDCNGNTLTQISATNTNNKYLSSGQAGYHTDGNCVLGYATITTGPGFNIVNGNSATTCQVSNASTHVFTCYAIVYG